MTKKLLLLFLALACATLAACGGSEPAVDTQATEVAAGVAATLTAQAPPPTVVVTPPPPTVVVTPPPPTVVVTPPAAATEEATSPDDTTIHLEADGSGNYASLKEAIAAARDGTTIILGPGLHRMDSALPIHTAIRLVGAGMDETEIVADGSQPVLTFQGEGPFSVEGITFRYEGTEVTNVVEVLDGEILFQRCRFTGGVSDEEATGGSGLYLTGSTTGQVLDSEAANNQLHGIVVRESAQPSLEGIVCKDNGQSGITYFDQAAGVARNNECFGNGGYGIYVDLDAAPTLEDNTVHDNQASGIAFWGNSSAIARGNTSTANAHYGIFVGESAAPTLEDNSLTGNGHSGIAYGNSAGGVARNNICSENQKHGIYLLEEAQPLLEGNTCNDNDDAGIAYFDNSGGSAQGNQCARNASHGIYVDEEAHPTLEANTCTDNGDTGIGFFGSSTGTARANTCSGNANHGIYVKEGANPSLMDNNCELGGAAAQGPVTPGAGQGKIAFISNRDGNGEVYVMDEDGSDWTRLTETEAAEYAPVWSPDGTKIAFISERNGFPQIFVMNADGSEQTALTEAPITLSPPSWSPDGQYLAFTSYAARVGDDIYVMAITDRMAEDGTGAIRLTEDLGSDRDPSWSPDGAYIAFISDREGPAEVFYMNADGSRQTLIPTTSGSKYGVRWSPDGGRYLVIYDSAVYTINRYGLNLMRVSSEVDFIGRSAWSPDASRIVYPSGGDFWVANTDGTGVTRLTDDPGEETHPDWWAPPGSVQFSAAPLGPRFNPDGDPWCLDAPEQGVAGNWQVVAPREPTFPGDSAEIGLRNKAGSGATYSVTARIIAPDESEAMATTTATDSEWLTLTFPADFEGGDTMLRGAYTILWEIDGEFVSCDGFVVAGGAGL